MSALFKDFYKEDNINKPSIDEFIGILQNLSSIQINTYLGTMIGLLSNQNKDLVIEKYEQGRINAGKEWDVKYKNSIPTLLSILQNRVAYSPVIINHIAKNIYIEKRTLDTNKYISDILQSEFNKKDFQSLFNVSVKEETIITLNNLIIETICFINKDIDDGKINFINDKFYNHVENLFTRIMDNDIKLETINKLDVRKCIEAIIHGYFDIKQNIMHSGCHEFVYVINIMIPRVLPTTYILSDDDKDVLQKLLKTYNPWDIR